MRELEEVKEQTLIDKFYHIPGPQNIADMATRTGVMLHELAEGSLWQLGPKFLRMPRELWPISREFRNLLPKEEKRTKFYTMFNAVQDRGDNALLQYPGQGEKDPSHLPEGRDDDQ